MGGEDPAPFRANVLCRREWVKVEILTRGSFFLDGKLVGERNGQPADVTMCAVLQDEYRRCLSIQ